jgi:hypothetical protein
MVVRDSLIDGYMTATPVGQSFLLSARGDVDAVIERNVLRRAGGVCIFIVTRSDLGGETNADIVDSDLDQCHPIGRAAAILVGPVVANLPSATRPAQAGLRIGPNQTIALDASCNLLGIGLVRPRTRYRRRGDCGRGRNGALVHAVFFDARRRHEDDRC